MVLDRPLQWLVCVLHLNELPFKHLFEFLDGITSGPNSFKCPIGKAINEDRRLLPIANFQPLNGFVNKLPETIISELSTDQFFLYHIQSLPKEFVQTHISTHISSHLSGIIESTH